jgi:hypothetical protein
MLIYYFVLILVIPEIVGIARNSAGNFGDRRLTEHTVSF